MLLPNWKASLVVFSLIKLVNEFLQAPPRPQHTFDMGQLLEEMQQIDQQSFRQAPQRGVTRLSLGQPKYTHSKTSLYWAPQLSAVQLQMWLRWRSPVTGLPSFSPAPTPPPHLGSPLLVTQLMLTGRGSLSLRLQVAEVNFILFYLIDCCHWITLGFHPVNNSASMFFPDPGRWAEEYLEQSEEKLWLGDVGDKESDW